MTRRAELSTFLNVEKPNNFRAFANSDENMVGEIINPDMNILKRLTNVRLSSKGITLYYSRELWGQKVKLSADKKNLDHHGPSRRMVAGDCVKITF